MYDFTGFPLVRLNSLQALFWLKGGDRQKQMANIYSKTWKGGLVILSPTLYAIATVGPWGNINDLPPPHRQFEMWQVANKPSVKYMECACRNYYDPEVQGPWHLRDKQRGMDVHHPFCQFERTAMPVWVQSKVSAEERAAAHLNPQTRPDEWIRRREELR